MSAEWLEGLRTDLELAGGAVVLVVDEARLAHLRPLAQLAMALDPSPWVAHRADQVLEAPPGSLVLMILEPGDQDSARILNYSRPVIAERGYRLVLVLLGPDGWTWPRLREDATDLAHWHSNRVVAPETHPFAPALVGELRQLGGWKLGLAWVGTRKQAFEALAVAGFRAEPFTLAGPYPEVLGRVRAADPEVAFVADEPWGREGRDPTGRTRIWLRLERVRLARHVSGHRGPLVLPGPWEGAGLLPFDARTKPAGAWHRDSADARLLGLLSDVDLRLVRWAEKMVQRSVPRTTSPRIPAVPAAFSILGLNRALLTGDPIDSAMQYFQETYSGHRETGWIDEDAHAPFAKYRNLPEKAALEQMVTGGRSARLELRYLDESLMPDGQSLPTAEELARGGPARRPGFGAFIPGGTKDDVRFAGHLSGDLGVMRAFGVEREGLPFVARSDPWFRREKQREWELVDGTALDEVLRGLIGEDPGAKVLAKDVHCPPLEAWAVLASARENALGGTAKLEARARSELEWVEALGLEPMAGWARAEIAWLDARRSGAEPPLPRFPDAFWLEPGFFEQLDAAWRDWSRRNPVPPEG